MALTLTVVAKGETENKIALTPGMVVEYVAHLPYGNVAIRLNGQKDIAHPACFKELR